MKKVLSFIALMLSVATWSWAQGTYALSEGETPTNGKQITSVANIIMTYSESSVEKEWESAVKGTKVDDFAYYTKGNGINGNKEGGTFVVFEPEKNGTVTVAVAVSGDKTFYVEEDGSVLDDYTVTPEVKTYTTYDISVKAGSSYKVYVSGSKMGFYGFTYTLSEGTTTDTDDNGANEYVWDFSEFTETVILSDDNITYDYEGLTLVGNTKSGYQNDYVSTAGLHLNGTSTSKIRYIKYTPAKDGVMTVNYYSNNNNATDRIAAVCTKIVTTSDMDELKADENFVAAGLTNGKEVMTVNANLKGGTTYYIYSANGGITINYLQYNVKADAPVISGDILFETSTSVTITAEEGAKIYYNDAGEGFTYNEYNEPFTLSNAAPIYAFAVVDGKLNSDTVTVSFNKVVADPTVKLGDQVFTPGETYDNILCTEQEIDVITPDEGYNTTVYWGTEEDEFTDSIDFIKSVSDTYDDHEFTISTLVGGKRVLYIVMQDPDMNFGTIRKYIFTNVCVPVTVTSAKFATFSDAYNQLDFSNSELTAYVVEGLDDRNYANLVTITEVPNNTGIIVKATKEGTYKVPVITDKTVESPTNLLHAVTEETNIGAITMDFYRYLLSNHNGIVGFYYMTKDVVVPAHKAFLETYQALATDEISAKVIFNFPDDDSNETTGIREVNSEKNTSDTYTLSGVKIDKTQKGIYIVNGKKVVVK